ncbi:hypothetical protein HZH68_009205 [Vespula germanica]|uniref:Rac GTPase-activating protein 1 n=1 Tax=Vespula germanica TaxID=30212 RepID=A0A834JW14_VESGE|nr:hypothetical protein HZH68_009205 [Vespula germanica]
MTASLSVLASLDEVVRCSNVLINGSCEEEFLQFAINQEEMRQKWLASVQECQRLHIALEKSHHEATRLDRKLSHARRLLNEEKQMRRAAEEEKNSLERQIALVRDLLFNDGGRNLNDETREKLQFLNNTSINARNSNVHIKDLHHNDKLNTIAELDSTGSILSDFSCFSKSEDDLDTSIIIQQNQKKREWKEHRPSGEYSPKKRRSTLQKVAELNTSDKIIATTTVTVPKEGAITASSVIEAIPISENTNPQGPPHSARKKRKSSDHSRAKLTQIDLNEIAVDTTPSAPKAEILTSGSDSETAFKPSPNIGGYTLNIKNSRGHSFTAKTVIKPEMCIPCGKRIRFGKVAVKCRDCKATAHTECKDLVPLPCVPTGNTPTFRGTSGTIADYAPMIPPMVPSLIVHCINEVELRGMSEQGLYRVNGGSTDVKCLKEKFLRGKGAPNLSDIDIPTIYKEDADAALYQAISELPQPNRDTLAFLILHLQRVSSSAECKMPISNLAKVFGPTLVGFSSQEPSPTSMLSETKNQVAIVESLLKIPSDYWANFVNPENLNNIGTPKTGELRHTPSTESLLKRTASRGFFHTPLTSSRTFMKKNKKYFATPPSRIGY